MNSMVAERDVNVAYDTPHTTKQLLLPDDKYTRIAYRAAYGQNAGSLTYDK